MATISVQTKKFGDLETATSASEESLLLIHDGSGVKTITAAKLIEAMLYKNAGAHNSIYRGKYLGSSVTDEQYTAISAGTFEDLYVGDYWTIDGVNWRIAALDYYLNCGDTQFTNHHAVIVPDTNLDTSYLAPSASTDGAYSTPSTYYTEVLSTAKTTINGAFGSSHILSHRIYIASQVTDGKESYAIWTDSTIDLMNIAMVAGHGMNRPVSDGSTVPPGYCEKTQLPMFALNPSLICNRSAWWLRDVITSSYFANVTADGSISANAANNTFGIRPAFCIG